MCAPVATPPVGVGGPAAAGRAAGEDFGSPSGQLAEMAGLQRQVVDLTRERRALKMAVETSRGQLEEKTRETREAQTRLLALQDTRASLERELEQVDRGAAKARREYGGLRAAADQLRSSAEAAGEEERRLCQEVADAEAAAIDASAAWAELEKQTGHDAAVLEGRLSELAGAEDALRAAEEAAAAECSCLEEDLAAERKRMADSEAAARAHHAEAADADARIKLCYEQLTAQTAELSAAKAAIAAAVEEEQRAQRLESEAEQLATEELQERAAADAHARDRVELQRRRSELRELTARLDCARDSEAALEADLASARGRRVAEQLAAQAAREELDATEERLAMEQANHRRWHNDFEAGVELRRAAPRAELAQVRESVERTNSELQEATAELPVAQALVDELTSRQGAAEQRLEELAGIVEAWDPYIQGAEADLAAALERRRALERGADEASAEWEARLAQLERDRRRLEQELQRLNDEPGSGAGPGASAKLQDAERELRAVVRRSEAEADRERAELLREGADLEGQAEHLSQRRDAALSRTRGLFEEVQQMEAGGRQREERAEAEIAAGAAAADARLAALEAEVVGLRSEAAELRQSTATLWDAEAQLTSLGEGLRQQLRLLREEA